MKDKRVEGGVDGNWSYRITGQPGKDKYLKVTVPLGSAKASYTLSGWIRADSTPTRSGRDFKVVAYHEEEDDDGDTIRYTAEQKLNTFSEGWKYFCLLLPAHHWKGTDITIRFYDNIGDLDIDGLQLTKNDVQTRQYDSSGKRTSRYTAQKTDSYTYDAVARPKTHKTAAGATYTNTYNRSNEVTRVAANIGPDTYYTYDQYGNVLTQSVYDPGTNTKPKLYSETTYTADGNFVTSTSDNDGNVTEYSYDTKTGQLKSTTLPARTSGASKVKTGYGYDEERRITGVSLSDTAGNSRSVSYAYGEFDDLTGIKHNGFVYKYTYDEFGNVTSTRIGAPAGANGAQATDADIKLAEYHYNSNNGSLASITYERGNDGNNEPLPDVTISNTHDVYGRVTKG